MVVLVTGGARSGKSRFAEKYAARFASRGVYLATSQIFDEEMRQRIALHKSRREQSAITWETVEEPYELSQWLTHASLDSTVAENQIVLVDCLTLWLSNWLLRYEHAEPVKNVLSKIDELCQTLSQFYGNIILVTNEVGYGIVPEYPLGRMFRDLAGMMNQQVAAISGQVFLVTAGIPLELKSNAFTF